MAKAHERVYNAVFHQEKQVPMENTLDFSVDLGGWKAHQTKTVTPSASPSEILFFLTQTTQGVDPLVEAGVRKIVDFSIIEKALAENPVSQSESNWGNRIAFLNSRKMGQAISEASALEKFQKKEQGEMAQFIRLIAVRKILAHHNVFVNYAQFYPALQLKEMGGHIQLIANYPGWKAIKKMTLHEKSGPRTFIEFLGSYSVSMDKKMEQYLGEVVDLKKVDAALAKGPAGKTAADLEKLAFFLGSTQFAHEMDSIVASSKRTGENNEKLGGLVRVYAYRRALEPCKLFVLYSQVEIPGLKRLLKKKA